MIYAGLLLSILIGVVIASFFKRINHKLLLIFSGFYLLSISVFHLLPEVYHIKKETTGIFMILGIMLQFFLESLSNGIEHGHIHKSTSLTMSMFVSICIHAFIEGMPLHFHPHEENRSLLYGIMLHKVPVSMVLYSFFVKSNISVKKTFIYFLIFTAMTPLGSYLAGSLDVLDAFHTEITSFVVGMLLYISIIVIFEINSSYRNNTFKTLAIVLASALAFFSS
ncbi:ZIP family metal transporter [Ichthyobacterium seriolicida]|uniref:Metal cation transporter, ZIP family n=1 Tax=Ichthyobacterium seriolicida TaxID=242600 RepID=A0A1J1DYU8_9FLAO|nr:ZIP family metal transporter [Ichthyobacterium seriolicida]BAV95098.1 metal cation transporter, ZIP family [Ichthyobacterium seriolicida]